ncbi:hypothetical protein ACET3Z_029313 [Daucus carota]
MIKTKATGRRAIKATPSSAGHITFTKRRGGLFKKASELCALTGAECAILCESLAGRVFAFGHPSVESVVDKYLGNKTASELPENNLRVHDELKKHYMEIAEEIEIEKNKSVKVKNEDVNNCGDMDQKGKLYWWERPFEHLGVEELEEYVSSLEDLMSKLKLRADDLMLIKSSSSMFNACKTLNDSNDGGFSGLVTEDVSGQSNELVANNDLDFSDDGFLNALLAMKDDELQFAGLL